MDNQLKRLQATELEILDEFVRVCELLGIEYFFECGSVLGAVRHEGFIPWDDDIDVGMMRNEYNLFLTNAPKYLGEKYYLESDLSEPNGVGLFAKLRNKNTVFDEGAENKVCNGIFIDIFPHDYLPSAEEERKKVIKHAQILRWLHIIQTIKKRKVAKGRSLKWRVREGLLRTVHPFLRIFPQNYFKNKMTRYVTQWNDAEKEWLTCHYDADPICMRSSEFFPLKKVSFCNHKYYVMNNTDMYLTQVYGNYMSLPPEKARITHLPERIVFEELQ